jgi:O-antigen ligase
MLGRLLSAALLLATLAVTPLWSLDPINPIKMISVVALGMAVFAVLLVNRRDFDSRSFKLVIALSIAFIVWLIVAFIASGAGYTSQLFGVNGRNTGLITYIGLVLLLVGAAVASSMATIVKINLSAATVGFASVCYGLLQAFGADPFEWDNPFSPVFGFLGNPNFQSSLLGILGSLAFAHLFSPPLKMRYRTLLALYLLLTLFVISETNSQQGFLVFLVGASVVCGIYCHTHFGRAINYSYWVAISFSFLGILLGILNRGPFANLLYKSSVTSRGDYWQAGWNMTLENPFFGVGLDSYGEWYRRSRTLEATLRFGPGTVSNAAHNVYLDLSSYGGFALVLIYSALMTLVAVSAYKVIKRGNAYNPAFAGIVAGWVGFQAQSLVSINQIGLAIWGWIFSGLIIGYEINTRAPSISLVEKKKGKIPQNGLHVSPATILATFIGVLLGALIAMPPYLASSKYKGALESGNPTSVREAAYIWPLESSRMIQVARTLNDNKFEKEGYEVALDAVEEFPNDYNAWEALLSMKKVTDAQKVEIMIELKRLDPHNPDLK